MSVLRPFALQRTRAVAIIDSVGSDGELTREAFKKAAGKLQLEEMAGGLDPAIRGGRIGDVRDQIDARTGEIIWELWLKYGAVFVIEATKELPVAQCPEGREGRVCGFEFSIPESLSSAAQAVVDAHLGKAEAEPEQLCSYLSGIQQARGTPELKVVVDDEAAQIHALVSARTQVLLDRGAAAETKDKALEIYARAAGLKCLEAGQKAEAETKRLKAREDRDLAAARAALEDKDVAKALGILDGLLEAHPKSVEGYFARGRAWVAYDQRKKAADDLEKAAQVRTDDAEVRARVGAFYAENGDYEKALGHCEAGLKSAPRSVDAQAELATEAALLHRGLGNLPQALERALDLEPGHVEASVALAEVYAVEGFHEAAKKRLLLAAQKYPKDARPYRQLGLVHLGQGDGAKAAAAFKQALARAEEKKELETLLLMARMKSLEGRTQFKSYGFDTHMVEHLDQFFGNDIALREAARLAWVNGMEVLRLGSMIGIYPLGLIVGKTLADGAAPRKRPLILLHGFWHNRTAFLVLLYRLRERGWSHVWTLNLPLFWGSIEGQAKRLGMFVEKVRRDADADQVDLIGHSLGGLIGWWYLSRMGGEETIRRLVAMGTPFGGTEVARIGMGGLEAEMLPGSATIRALRVGGGKLRKRVTSIFSTDDALVVPHTRARFPGGRNIKVRNTGHLGLLYSREVFAAIENALSAQGPPSRIGKRRGQPPDDGTQPPRRDSRLPRTYL